MLVAPFTLIRAITQCASEEKMTCIQLLLLPSRAPWVCISQIGGVQWVVWTSFLCHFTRGTEVWPRFKGTLLTRQSKVGAVTRKLLLLFCLLEWYICLYKCIFSWKTFEHILHCAKCVGLLLVSFFYADCQVTDLVLVQPMTAYIFAMVILENVIVFSSISFC